MPQKALEPSFLHVYDVELGSWAFTTLGSPVSLRIVEAMNLILQKDGILAFIGTRSEFGHYLFNLKQETGKDFRHCWTSLPASTVMSMLGLCQNTENPRKPELVFYGSPLTLALAYIMDTKKLSGMDWLFDQNIRTLQRQGYLVLEVAQLESLGALGDRMITATEYQEALSYLEERIEDVKLDQNVSERENQPIDKSVV
jgi:hypothetical protein